MSICYNCQESGDCDDEGPKVAGCGDYKRAKTRYICPDCGWTLETRARRIRCGNCGSLNLERKLPGGGLIKADAWELDPNNARLIHYPMMTEESPAHRLLRTCCGKQLRTDNAIAEDEGQTHSIDRDYDKTQ